MMARSATRTIGSTFDGTTTLFWSIDLRSVCAIDCCEKHRKALKVLSILSGPQSSPVLG